MYQKVIFREYDIRGVVDRDFDTDFAKLLGKAYARLHKKMLNIDKPTIAVGHDARLSSPPLAKALIHGLNESGFNVLSLGLVTTPISYFSCFEVPRVSGAIMITGSHNPPEYNGFKISVGKSTIFGEKIQDIKKIIEQNDFISGSGSLADYDIFPSYIERYKKEFGTLKDVKVILDCGNGTAGVAARALFEAVGLKPEILFEKPDGDFPNHHPDPTVEENLEDLKKAVLANKAAVGIGFDGDCDRIGIVDENGRMVYGDELMVIVARDILSQNPGAKIIGDVKCSDRMYQDIAQHGGVPIMWKTGHSLIKEKIKSEKAPFGGEMSGHIFFADRNYGYDDALYAALRVVEIIARTGKPVSQLLKGLPPAHNTPELRIDTTEEKKVLIVDKLKEAFSGGDNADYQLNLIDGIRISFKNGWALARASNTQPVLVLRFESDTEQGLKEIRSRIESITNQYL